MHQMGAVDFRQEGLLTENSMLNAPSDKQVLRDPTGTHPVSSPFDPRESGMADCAGSGPHISSKTDPVPNRTVGKRMVVILPTP